MAALAKSVQGAARLFTPGVVATLYYLVRSGARVSHRSEVDITKNLRCGRGFVVGSFTKIKAFDGEVTFGNRAGIANGCFIAAGGGGIEIGDNFICGPNVNIIAVNYRHGEVGEHLEDQGTVSRGIKIGSNVWIGAGCTITDGAVIGDNTIVGAGSLVNRRYPPNAILQGSPAKVIMKR